MPIVFDSVLTAALARDLAARWTGRRLERLGFDAEARRIRLGLSGDAWVWLLHPSEGVVAPVPRTRRRRGERGLLDGPRRVVSVGAPLDTRWIVVRLDGPDDREEVLAVELASNRWNALHVVEGRIHRVLVPDLGRDPPVPGAAWEAPVSERRWAENAPGPEEWAALSAADGGGALRRRIAWLSGMNEQWVLGGAAEGASAEPPPGLERYLALRRAALHDPPAGWLVPARAAGDDDPPARPYPHPLGAAEAERAGTPLDALAAWGSRAPRVRDALRDAAEDPETGRLREALRASRERTARKIRALEAQIGGDRDPEELRRLGHLLLARKADVPAGAEEAGLEDFTGERVIVALDPRLDAVGNAEAYYDEAKRIERAAKLLPRRIAAARRRVAEFDAALARLDEDGPDEEAWKLAGGRRRVLAGDAGGGARRGSRQGGPGEAGGAPLPYRVYHTSSGLEVRAGRSARANDELTFRHSAPDDIWMHVREAPGSHVVLRWGRRDQNPPERDIAEAALVAAVLSRARGSTVVPVAWTRRKYVRKPRKAGPGTVVPERTQTVFVAPDPKKVERMKEREP